MVATVAKAPRAAGSQPQHFGEGVGPGLDPGRYPGQVEGLSLGGLRPRDDLAGLRAGPHLLHGPHQFPVAR